MEQTSLKWALDQVDCVLWRGPGRLCVVKISVAPGCRVGLYHAQKDRSGVPPAECSAGVCRRSTWPWRTHCVCETVCL